MLTSKLIRKSLSLTPVLYYSPVLLLRQPHRKYKMTDDIVPDDDIQQLSQKN